MKLETIAGEVTHAHKPLPSTNVLEPKTYSDNLKAIYERQTDRERSIQSLRHK